MQQMIIDIKNGKIENLHQSFKANLGNKFVKNGYEYKSVIRKKGNRFTINGFSFGNGFDFNAISGSIETQLQLAIKEDDNNYLRFIIIKNGELIHTVSKNIRYRLNAGFSSLVAAKEINQQTITLPSQNSIELYILQVDTKRFDFDLDNAFFSIPKNLEKVLGNDEMEEHFIYQSYYSYSVSEVISEILNTPKEGLTKRFFLESKALELLWISTEQYLNELKYGYDNTILKKVDIQLITKAKEYIHQNFNTPITLSILSKELGTNETKLKTGFKKLYGKSFLNILMAERMNRAKLYLEEGQLSIKEIAFSCGYKSISMFTSRFKEYYGVVPSKFKSS